MATNDKTRVGKVQGQVLDVNSPEAQKIMKEIDEQHAVQESFMSMLRGEEQTPTEVGTGLDPLYGAGRAAHDAQVEEKKLQDLGNAKGMVEPGSEEDQKLNNRMKVQQKSADFAKAKAAAENQPFSLDPAERTATDLGAIEGSIWRGQARYTNGLPPALIATPDGRMYYNVGHYVIPVKDQQEAAFYVGLDQQMFADQERRKKNRIEEMELAAALETMDDESATFESFNRSALERRMELHSSSKTPEELQMLQSIYDDPALIQRLLRLNPEAFANSLDQLEMILAGGGSMSDARSVINNAGRHQRNSRNAVSGNVANGFSSLLESQSNAIDDAQAEIDDLSLKIAEEQRLLKIDAEMETSEGNAEKLEILKEMRRRAQTKHVEAKSSHRRIESELEMLRSKSGASWSPEYGGGRNLDQMFAMPSRKKSLTRVGAPVWCMMDAVARINGFDGLSDGNLRSMLSDPERAAEFIRECQGYAESVGWETSQDNTMPWVESIIEHVITTEDPERVKGVVQAVMADVAADADMPEAPLYAATDEGKAESGKKSKQFLQTVSTFPRMTPLARQSMESGTRPATKEGDDEVWFNVSSEAAAAGFTDAEMSALKAEYDNLPRDQAGGEGAEDPYEMTAARSFQRDPSSPLASGHVEKDQPGVTAEDLKYLETGWIDAGSGQEKYLNILQRVLMDRLPENANYRFAMNPDGVFSRERSDQEWEKVEEEARKFAKESANIPTEEIEMAMEILRSRRHGN